MKTLYLDCDGVLADFEGRAHMCGLSIEHASRIAGFYQSLDVLGDAKKNVIKLCESFDVFVASAPSLHNKYSSLEKQIWIDTNFPWLSKKLILTRDKSKLLGDYLIDDHPEWANASNFKGKLIHFKGDWKDVWNQL